MTTNDSYDFTETVELLIDEEKYMNIDTQDMDDDELVKILYTHSAVDDELTDLFIQLEEKHYIMLVTSIVAGYLRCFDKYNGCKSIIAHDLYDFIVNYGQKFLDINAKFKKTVIAKCEEFKQISVFDYNYYMSILANSDISPVKTNKYTEKIDDENETDIIETKKVLFPDDD